MTEKLVKYRTPEEPPPSWSPGALAAPEAPREVRLARLAMLAGPVIGFALAAMLVVSFALAFAGGVGDAATGGRHAATATHTAIFVL